jgi:hypothetical protein
VAAEVSFREPRVREGRLLMALHDRSRFGKIPEGPKGMEKRVVHPRQDLAGFAP